MANACPNCGFENATDARQCPGCGTELPPAKMPQIAGRRVRVFELLLVLFVAFSASIVASLHQFFGGELPPTSAGSIKWVYSTLRELAALGVLAYVLFRQGRGFAGIGKRWKATDIPMTLVLLTAAYGGYVVWVLGVEQKFIPPGQEIARQAEANRHLFEGGVSVAAVVFMIINGFFEELIVRAFVITELKQLTGNVAIAIFASVAIQVSYHLYQGLPAALSHVPMFLIFSIYYQRTNRIFPIAMAHVVMDLLILFHHVMTVS
jgi:membrane protease YdiL (CAAX protease family)